MKTYQKNNHEYFYDINQRLWVMYPIDINGLRIEWDINDNPLEVLYFVNKNQLNYYLQNL